MLRLFRLSCLGLLLAGCGGVAWDTRIAENAATRLAMIESVRIGDTTEMQLVGRWGNPLQKLRDGGNVDYIYRSRTGDQSRYVIVTFQHGVAIAVRSNETEGCRGSFAPRIPGYGGDTPDTVKPVGWCVNTADPYLPNGFWLKLADQAGVSAAGQDLHAMRAAALAQQAPGVGSDDYVAGPGSIK